MQFAVNILAFNVIWFACVLGAGAGHSLLGPILFVCWLPVHLCIFRADASVDIRLLAIAVAVGLASDGAFMAIGLIDFPKDPASIFGYPLWMMALWGNFALALRHSLIWMTKRPKLSAILGGIFGPAAYYTGDKLGAAELAGPTASNLGILVAIWCLATFVLISCSNRHDS